MAKPAPRFELMRWREFRTVEEKEHIMKRKIEIILHLKVDADEIETLRIFLEAIRELREPWGKSVEQIEPIDQQLPKGPNQGCKIRIEEPQARAFLVLFAAIDIWQENVDMAFRDEMKQHIKAAFGTALNG